MEDFIIVVNRIEELQSIQDRQEIERIFERAKRTVVGGMNVVLVRRDTKGGEERFDTISNEQDLIEYRDRVLRLI